MIFLRQAFFIHLLIRIFHRMLHHHTSRRSDDLPSQKNILQAEGLDLLPVIRRPYPINLEQQKQIVSQHHQLEDCLIIACRPQPGNGAWELHCSCGNLKSIAWRTLRVLLLMFNSDNCLGFGAAGSGGRTRSGRLSVCCNQNSVAANSRCIRWDLY